MNAEAYEVLAAYDEPVERINEQADPKRKDFVQRLGVRAHASSPLLPCPSILGMAMFASPPAANQSGKPSKIA